MLQGWLSPCEGFRGWKGISVKGRLASRSYGDLRIFRGFEWHTPTAATKREKVIPGPGHSTIERLPIEILNAIIDNLLLDVPPGDFKPRNSDLIALLLSSRALHTATLSTLYKNVTIPHSKVFRKFLNNIMKHPSLGTIVRRLDFSHFNPTGAGMTREERANTMNLTSDTLLRCLDLLPNLREFLGQEHIEEELSAAVVHKLLTMPRMRGIDMCAASCSTFRDAMMVCTQWLVSTQWHTESLPLSRLSFHECSSIPASVYSTLLSRLPLLSHLDVAHTQITASALNSIPHTAKLTHLNLSRCSHISGSEVVDFLTTHPAAKTLVYLNLMTDAKSHQLLNADDLSRLLPALPNTLRSLNLKGSKMLDVHIQQLVPLSQHLEELGLGRSLLHEDVVRLLLPPSPALLPATATGPDFAAATDAHDKWRPHGLKYIDISDYETKDIDMTLFFSKAGSLLRNNDLQLDVIELSESMMHAVSHRSGTCQHFGWVVKGEGRRGWLVRERKVDSTSEQHLIYRGTAANKWTTEGNDVLEHKKDDGSRSWKMGATYWGLRKVPVAVQEVGGMYGLYMFKR